jgi:acetyl esterase/lipase
MTALLISALVFASAGQSPVVAENVVYGTSGGTELLLDVVSPAGAGVNRPALLLIHGGGWAAGNKQSMRPWATRFAGSGFVCFAVGYRLVKPNANKYPAQIDDVQRAVRWVRHNAAKYGIDPKNIGAIGASAGGHLVALLGTRETRDKGSDDLSAYSSKVQAVVDVFGPSDFTVAVDEGISAAAIGIVANFLGKLPAEAPDLYKEASPVHHVTGDDAPFLIFHGTIDPLVPIAQSRILHKALTAAGVKSKLIEFEGEGHGLNKPANNETLATESITFLRKELGQK